VNVFYGYFFNEKKEVVFFMKYFLFVKLLKTIVQHSIKNQ